MCEISSYIIENLKYHIKQCERVDANMGRNELKQDHSSILPKKATVMMIWLHFSRINQNVLWNSNIPNFSRKMICGVRFFGPSFS